MLIQDLEYADVMVLVSDSMDILEELLKALDATCSGMGLTISARKTSAVETRGRASSSCGIV